MWWTVTYMVNFDITRQAHCNGKQEAMKIYEKYVARSKLYLNDDANVQLIKSYECGFNRTEQWHYQNEDWELPHTKLNGGLANNPYQCAIDFHRRQIGFYNNHDDDRGFVHAVDMDNRVDNIIVV